MALADLDFCELHVTIKDYFTSKPYVDPATGITSADLPYEACSYTDEMYEPRKSTFSTAKVRFPSLLTHPHLRGILNLAVKDGARVELYNFQPDCGEPVFAGYLSPGGWTEANGSVELDVDDSSARGKWWRVRRIEEYSQPVDSYYRRAMSHFVDVVNDKMTSGNPQARWSGGTGTYAGYDNTGAYLQAPADIPSPGTAAQSQGYSLATFNPNPGSIALLEFDATVVSDFHVPIANPGQLDFSYQVAFSGTNLQAGIHVRTDVYQGQPVAMGYRVMKLLTVGAIQYQDSSVSSQSAVPDESGGVHYTILLSFATPGLVSMSVYRENVYMGNITAPGDVTVATNMQAEFLPYSRHGGTKISLKNFRMSQMVPYLGRAARFVPQTSDAVYYLANQESNFDYLNLFAEKDNAEYRTIYHVAPQLDELELDGYQTLGKNASALLSYGQPGAGSASSPKAAPFSAVADVGAFAVAPPFRFEEGYNLAAIPKRMTPARPHANQVVRTGSSQMDAQMSSVVWATTEVGGDGGAATYPYFETLVNDDRVGLKSINKILADQELQRCLDPTPSLDIQYVEQLEYAFKWRAGDTGLAKTQSLMANVEQTMRVARVQHQSGQPVRNVLLGRLDFTPDMLRDLSTSMVQSWLYDQSGSSGTVYVYPNVGSIAAGATSPAFTIQLDQITTGTQIIYAALHWFLGESPVSEVTGIVNSVPISPVKTSGTDSGLALCTQLFLAPGSYTFQFKNNGAGAHNLTGAFVVIRIKM